MLAGGCGWNPAPDTSRTLTVDQVLKSIHTLDGKTVTVEGYMPNCGGYDCGLFANEKAYTDFRRIIDQRTEEDLPDFLSIGYDEQFDRKAGPLAGRYVIVAGTVSDECRDWRGRMGCTDRAPDLVPLDIRVSRSKPSISGRTSG